MSLLGGHLGNRVSALLDGQLPDAEAERAWEHVQECHACRDRVEREGWVKRRLAGLSYDAQATAPDRLKGSLLDASELTPGEWLLGVDHHRRNVALAAVGGGAIGAAVMGVLALGAAPASAPTTERPLPVVSMTGSGTTVVVHRERPSAP
jgi:predicted anti-sigma-YlaC factor YlaD